MRGMSPEHDHFTLGARAQRSGDTATAESHYRRALEADASDQRCWANLGLLLLRTDRLEAAATALERATALDPGDPVSLCYLGEALLGLLRGESARRALERALALSPDMARAHMLLGRALDDAGLPARALEHLEAALASDQKLEEARWPRLLALFRLGRWKEGFAGYEERFARPDCRPAGYPQPVWDGSPLDGRTILLHHEQGLGDTVMCCRFAPLVAERGGRVLLGCQPELAELAATAPGVDRVVVPGQAFRADCRAPLMSLPAILGRESGLGMAMEDIPAPPAYLSVPPGAVCPVPRPRGTRLAVGIVWAGNPKHTNDRHRSAPLELFLGLAALPGVTLYSLQHGPRAVDITALGASALVRHLPDAAGPFPAKAAAMAGLDLLVTVDTCEAHLAGALGRPVWMLLPFRCDWRWLPGRTDTVWYPSMRLYHQPGPDRWAEVFEVLARDLARELVRAPARPLA